MKNIMPVDIDSSMPNINKPYTVTDKADGERKYYKTELEKSKKEKETC